MSQRHHLPNCMNACYQEASKPLVKTHEFLLPKILQIHCRKPHGSRLESNHQVWAAFDQSTLPILSVPAFEGVEMDAFFKYSSQRLEAWLLFLILLQKSNELIQVLFG